MKKLKKKLSNLYSALANWIFVPGRSTLLVIGIILAVIIVVMVLVGICLGCLGSLIFAIVSLPALLLMLGFNWVVPIFGGPTITFRAAIGFILLTCIMIGIIHGVRK